MLTGERASGRMDSEEANQPQPSNMFTKVLIDGKVSLKETIKYHLSLGRPKKKIRGSALTHLNGMRRRSYQLDRKFF